MAAPSFLTERPFAHRGLHDATLGIVENTATAVRAALAFGYGIEVDIQASAEGEAMVFHDFTLDRLTRDSGFLAERTAAELKEVRLKGTTDRMMTLAELLEMVGGRVPLLVEIKSAFAGDVRLARRAAELVQAAGGPVALMSFDPAMVAEVRRRAPGVPRGIVAERDFHDDEAAPLSRWRRRVLGRLLHWPSSRFQFVAYRVADLSGPFSRIVRWAGFPLLTWTVRTEGDVLRALKRADQVIFEGLRPLFPLRGRAVSAKTRGRHVPAVARAPVPPPEGRLRTLSSIKEIAPAAWDACADEGDGAPDPFASHAFLSSLEDAELTGGDTCWQPRHLVLEEADGTIGGVVPAFLKGAGPGDYLRDREWALAYQQAGGAYYPMIQAAIPYSPGAGRRLLARPKDGADARAAQLAAGLVALAQTEGVPCAYVTFHAATEQATLAQADFLAGTDHLYCWRNKSYGSFEDFLGDLTSERRYDVQRERKEARAGGITLEWRTGSDLTEGVWDAFFPMYESTFHRNGGTPYFNRAFFSLLGERMGERIHLLMARKAGRSVAGSFHVVGRDRLFTRHWGMIEPLSCLHFEMCYYQPVDFALAHGLSAVDAGPGGTHKLQRGFLPQITHFAHHVSDPVLHDALARFLPGQRGHAARLAAALTAKGPFRRGVWSGGTDRSA